MKLLAGQERSHLNARDEAQEKSSDPCENSGECKLWPARLGVAYLLTIEFALAALPEVQMMRADGYSRSMIGKLSHIDTSLLVFLTAQAIAIPGLAISSLRFSLASHAARFCATVLLVFFAGFISWLCIGAT